MVSTMVVAESAEGNVQLRLKRPNLARLTDKVVYEEDLSFILPDKIWNSSGFV